MAHQTTSLPWRLLSSTLHVSTHQHPPNPDLHLRHQPDQGRTLSYFITAFDRAVREHAATARRAAFPPRFEDEPVPTAEAVLLTPETVARIAPTVRKARERGEREGGLGGKIWDADGDNCGRCEGAVCRAGSREGEEGQEQERWERCGCAVPMAWRRGKAFCQAPRPNDCDSVWKVNGRGLFAVEVIKVLVLYGEMETVLRACQVPGVRLKEWWRVRPYCGCEVSGRHY